MKAKLYIIATPIGNLKDITLRALDSLKEADLILCEDSRVTRKLLNAYQVSKPLLSYHQRSKLDRIDKVVEHLGNGKTLALVTDAGTPGISDPGNELVSRLIEKFGQEIEIIPVPGPSALTCLAQAAGTNLARFLFLGFPPNKKGRQTFFIKLLQSEVPVVYYDSPYRFLKNIELLASLSPRPLRLVVGRELTKIFEEIKRGNAKEIMEYYQANPDKMKGEFVVIVC